MKIQKVLTLFMMAIFRAAHGWGAKRPALPKLCHTYPAMMKLGTVIPYLKMIQKIYESRDTAPEFCWRSIFHRKSANFVISRNTLYIACIMYYILYDIIYYKYIALWYIISNFFNFSWVFEDLFNKPGYKFDDVSQNGYHRPS